MKMIAATTATMKNKSPMMTKRLISPSFMNCSVVPTAE